MNRPWLLLINVMIIFGAGINSIHAEPLLPDHRIVAYYGNFYSKRMGILGEFEPEEVLRRLHQEVEKWEKADTHTPVIPGIEYISVVAQKEPGSDGKHRYRMPDNQIRKAIDMANQVKGIAILDVQVGFSNVESEIPRLAPYLVEPNVMLALDPEFDMFDDRPPGTVIGSMDAKEINYVINYLAQIVRNNHLPPKILIVHRFTQRMVTNAHDIKPVPEVQVVMDMDGWGGQELKMSSYKHYIAPEPVQFTGFKLFYKNDTKAGGDLYTPQQILKFNPIPMFILYQ